MFARIAPGYDRANRVASLGIDQAWRRAALRALGNAAHGDVVDLCAGTLDLSAMITGARSVVAVDFCKEMLDAGRAKAPGARLVCADARELPLPAESADAVIAGFGIRNVPEPGRAVAEVARVLRPGGVFVCLDFFRPATVAQRILVDTYNTLVLPVVGGWATGQPSAYRYLVQSMDAWLTRAQFQDLLAGHRFREIDGWDLFPPVASIARGVK
jgi:ubiquinone/menaquinone biosynthesis methyltransferase